MTLMCYFSRYSRNIQIVLCLFTAILSCKSAHTHLEVELISLGTVSPVSTTSLVFIAPAIETAIIELKTGHKAPYLNFSLTIFKNSNVSDGNDVPAYSTQELANWFYLDRSRTANVSVLLIPGNYIA